MTQFDIGMVGAVLGMVAMALGFEASAAQFGASLMFGLMGAFAASRILTAELVKDAKPLPFVPTMLVGLVFSIVGGQVSQLFDVEIPLSLAMFTGGFLSSFIGPAALKFASAISKSIPDITTGLIHKLLPKKNGGGDGRL